MVNPLDKAEYQQLLEIMNKQVPKITPRTVDVSYNFDQRLPKNLMDYAARLDKIFLDGFLHVIEEIWHRTKNMKYSIGYNLSKAFKEYHLRYFQAYGNLRHDNFFKDPELSFLHKPIQIGIGSLTSIIIGNGATLTSGNTAVSNNTGWSGILRASRTTSDGVFGTLYNQFAADISASTSGHVKMGCYDDNANPNNLLVDSGSKPCPSGGTFTSPFGVREFYLTTSKVWISWTTDDNSIGVKSSSGGLVSGSAVDKNGGFTFSNPQPNPFGNTTNVGGSEPHLQVSHT